MKLELPINLEQLKISRFNIEVKSLEKLLNLTQLEFYEVDDIALSDNRPFDCLEELNDLSIENSLRLSEFTNYKNQRLHFCQSTKAHRSGLGNCIDLEMLDLNQMTHSLIS